LGRQQLTGRPHSEFPCDFGGGPPHSMPGRCRDGAPPCHLACSVAALFLTMDAGHGLLARSRFPACGLLGGPAR
jgi:hypothetical protein